MATTQQFSGVRSEPGRDEIERDRSRNPDTNPDAITGAPGSHPVGTGIGAASGGAAAAAAGAAIGSVVPGVGTAIGAVTGGVIGAVAGAFGGGLVGKDVAESINPTLEDAYWRKNYQSRPYYNPGDDYDTYSPAYRYGWESRAKNPDKTYDDVEDDLAQNWDSSRANSTLTWDKARSATRDAWDRAGSSTDASLEPSDAVSTLNDLILILKDGENGFSNAASNVKDPSLKSVFEEYAHQRAQMAAELQAQVRQLGGEEETDGHAAGSLHRGWMNIKTSLGGGDQSILNEAERGEDAAKVAYNKALQEILPAELNTIVQRQFAQIKQAHDRVKALRDAAR